LTGPRPAWTEAFDLSKAMFSYLQQHLEQLIGGHNQHTEHEVRENLGPAFDTDVPQAVIFQMRKYPFNRTALVIKRNALTGSISNFIPPGGL